MKLTVIAVLAFALTSSVIAMRSVYAAQRRINIVGPVENIRFGPLINAPNGHISLEKRPNGYRIWTPGRLGIPAQKINEEGGFLFEMNDRKANDLAQAQPTFMDLGHYPTFMSLGKTPGHLSLAGYTFYLWGCQGGGTPGGRQTSSRAFTITVPDFSLGFDDATIITSAPRKVTATVNINRTAGFTGNVTIAPPATLPVGIKLPRRSRFDNREQRQLQDKA